MVRSLVVGTLLAGLLLPGVGQAEGKVPSHATCGTLDALELHPGRVLRRPPAGAARRACEDNPRPSYDDEKTYVDSEFGFTIHYTTDTSDSAHVTTDQVDKTAEVMRHVMDMENLDLKYKEAPSDEADSDLYCETANGGAANGGDGGYDIYFVDDDGVYGYAQPMTLVDGDHQGSSFLALSTWIFDYEGALEVTVAHEFFHAIQFGYDVYENSFWMENTAVWMEEQVYDSVNDYLNYVPDAFSNPDVPLDSDDSIMYAYGIWPLYMSQKTSQGAIQDIWEACEAGAEENAFEAQAEVMDEAYEGGWEQLVLDFRGAMFNRDDFEEGGSYPAVDIYETYTSFPATDSLEVDHTGALFLKFKTSVQGQLNLCFTGNKAETRAKVYTIDGSRNIEEVPLEPADNAGRVILTTFGGDIKEVVLVGTYAYKSGSDVFSFSATVGDAVCEPGEVGQPSNEDDSPTPYYICGGCVEVTPVEKHENNAATAGLVSLLFTAAVIFRRRRV